jgi:hypothetical protein
MDEPVIPKAGNITEVGYKNPPTHTQFGAGESGNPIGKTSEQRKAEIDNAEKATFVRGILLDAIIKATEEDGSESLKFIEAGVLKLLKDAEDRGLGTAKQQIAHTSPDGSMTPTRIERTIVDPANTDT